MCMVSPATLDWADPHSSILGVCQPELSAVRMVTATQARRVSPTASVATVEVAEVEVAEVGAAELEVAQEVAMLGRLLAVTGSYFTHLIS